MAETKDPIARFRHMIAPFKDIWRSLDVRTASCQRDGTWRNVFTSIRLSPDPPPPKIERMKSVDLGDFRAGHFGIDLDPYLDTILDDLPGNRVGLPQGEVLVATIPNAWDVRGLPREYLQNVVGRTPDFRSFILQGMGESLQTFWDHTGLERLDARLLGHDPPYRGLNDLARSLGDYIHDIALGTVSLFAIVAPLFARLEPEYELKEGSLTVRGIGPATSRPSDFRLATILWEGSEDRRPTYPLSDADSTATPNGLRLTKSVEVGAARSAEVFLLFRNEPVDEVRLVLPSAATENPRLRAHLHFDPDLAKLNRFLAPKTSDRAAADLFDLAVGWVAHLCGFEAINYGLKGMSVGDEIDVLAFVPYSRSVVAIEATSRDILNKDKLTKLRRRVDELAADLPASDITAAVATALETTYSTEEDEARELKVSILRPKNLSRLLEMAQENRPAADALEYIKGLTQPGSYWGRR